MFVGLFLDVVDCDSLGARCSLAFVVAAQSMRFCEHMAAVAATEIVAPSFMFGFGLSLVRLRSLLRPICVYCFLSYHADAWCEGLSLQSL